jgi:hypothetical protein
MTLNVLVALRLHTPSICIERDLPEVMEDR